MQTSTNVKLTQSNLIDFSSLGALFFDLLVPFFASFMISLSALISMKISISLVPLSLAPHMCLFLGAVLGSRKGFLAVVFYILQGLAGFSVFGTGQAGLLHLLGPTGGYIVGYAVGAYLTGFFKESGIFSSQIGRFYAFALGNLAIYVYGIAQLSFYTNLPTAILTGSLPFILGDIIKIGVCSKLLSKYFRIT